MSWSLPFSTLSLMLLFRPSSPSFSRPRLLYLLSSFVVLVVLICCICCPRFVGCTLQFAAGFYRTHLGKSEFYVKLTRFSNSNDTINDTTNDNMDNRETWTAHEDADGRRCGRLMKMRVTWLKTISTRKKGQCDSANNEDGHPTDTSHTPQSTSKMQ
jgi:hypothetical protein